MRDTIPVPTPTSTSPAPSAPARPSRTPDADAPPVSEQVVAATATVTGVDPTEMEPLNAVVDPDGLDALFAGPLTGSGSHSPTGSDSPTDSTSPTDSPTGSPSGRVTFTFAGCDVAVREDATVAVTPHGEDEPAWDTATDPVPPIPGDPIH